MEVLSVVTHEFITALSVEVSTGELKLGVMPKTSPFHINDFDHYHLMPYKKFLHMPLCRAPQKCFQSGPELAKAGLAPLAQTSSYATVYNTHG